MAASDNPGAGGKDRQLYPKRGRQLLIGRLRDHGPANYQFRQREDPSYYVRLVTSRGERILWGKDLQRALEQSETKARPGDLVGARRVGREAVTITTRERDSEGRVMAQQEHHVHRTQWEVEKVTFFADRVRLARRLRDEQIEVGKAVQERPELRSTYLSIPAAEKFAARRIADPKDRVRFMELVKGALASSIYKGEPLPSVSLRDKLLQKTHPTPKKPDPEREDPTR